MTYYRNSRRNFLKTLTTSTLISGTSLAAFADIGGKTKNPETLHGPAEIENEQQKFSDGPASSLFEPLQLGETSPLQRSMPPWFLKRWPRL